VAADVSSDAMLKVISS